MGRLITTFKDKTFEPSMKSYYQLFSDDTTTAPQIYDSLLYVRGTNAGSLAVGQENDQGPSTVEEYDTYMPVRFYNVKSESDGTTPASPTHTFFSLYNRAEYAGPINQNMYDVWADYNVAKLSNAGYITNSLGGAYNSGYDHGSGDGQTIPAIYGSLNYAEIQPTGDNRVVTYAQGSRSWVKLNKANATATYVYPTTSEFNQTTGTVGTLAMHKFDLDYTAGAITNAYFIWADESSVPTPSGEAYFIKSNIPWQTLLSGPLTNTGAVTFNSTLAVTGVATLSSDVNIGGNLVVTGTSTFNGGTITIGDAASDNVVFGADVDSHIIPDDDNTYDLGSNSQEWRDLYIDGTAYVDTISMGGNIDLPDSSSSSIGRARFGDSQDLQIYHDGSNNYIQGVTGDMYIQNGANDKDIIFRSDDGSGGQTEYFRVDGQYDASVFTKNISAPDNVYIAVGSLSKDGDARFYHDGTNSYLKNETGELYIVNASDDKDIIFQSDDGSGGLSTYFQLDGSALVTNFPDNSKLTIGSGNDLQIYHDGSHSYIKDTGTGNLTLDTDGAQINLQGGGENFAIFRKDTSVDLYYNGSKKFETTNTGATVSGNLLVSSGTDGDAIITIQSDTDNNNENDSPQLQFKQDGGNTIVKAGITGDAGQIFTSSLANAAYFGNDEAASVQFYTNATAKLTIESAGNVGIGTTNPASKLEVDGGDIEVDDSGSGLILRSPDGTRYRVTVANGGTLSVASV